MLLVQFRVYRGSSDFHGIGPIGLCRTYVFAREASEQGILEALRQGHTVVYGNHGDAYGDAALIALAAQYGRLREREPAAPRGGFLGWLSRICGVAGMLGLTVSEFRGRPRTAPATFTMTMPVYCVFTGSVASCSFRCCTRVVLLGLLRCPHILGT